MTPGISIVKAFDDGQLALCYCIRKEVFVDEQQVSLELEIDEKDTGSDHYLMLCEGKAVAAGRIYYEAGAAVIGRLAVRASYRGKGLGHILMRRMLADIAARKVSIVRLGAHVTAAAFYTKLGFVSYGKPYDDAGIPHIGMHMDFRGYEI